MASLLDLHPCPHCGKEMHAGAMTRHAPMCFKNPATFARCRAALTDPADSSRGITLKQYNSVVRAADTTLPARITLLYMTGTGPWNDMLAVFGLLPPDARCPHCGREYLHDRLSAHIANCKAARPKCTKPPKAIKPVKATKPAPAPTTPPKPRKPMNILVPRKPRATPPKITCPACGAQRTDMRRHVCPEDPAVVAWLAEHLPDPDDSTRIITLAQYKALPDKAISLNTISSTYGNWAGLAARYGLEVRSSKRPDGPPKLDPASLAELHRLAIELHDGEYGPSHGEYTIHATGPAMGTAGLKKLFGTWAAVLTAAGLRHGSHSYYVLAANARRKAHEAARGPRGPVASLYERDDEPVSRHGVGLPVASVQKLTIISCPDEVYKGYVRTMIR